MWRAVSFYQLWRDFSLNIYFFFCSWSLYDPVLPQAAPAPVKKVKIRATSGELHLRDPVERRVTRRQNLLRLKQQVLLSSASLLQLTPTPSLSPQMNPGPPVTSVLQRRLVAPVKHLSRMEVKPWRLSRLRRMRLSKKVNQSPKLSQNHKKRQRTERETLKSEFFFILRLSFKLLFKTEVIVLLWTTIF